MIYPETNSFVTRLDQWSSYDIRVLVLGNVSLYGSIWKSASKVLPGKTGARQGLLRRNQCLGKVVFFTDLVLSTSD